MNAVTFVILSFAAYRLARLIALDTILEVPRDAFYNWLCRKPGYGRQMIGELLKCGCCLSVWTAAGVLTFWFTLVDDWPGWAFAVYLPAVAAGSWMAWSIADRE